MSDNIIEITETSNYSITIDTNLVQNDNGVTIETSSPYSIEIIDNNIVLLNDLPQGYPLNWTSGNLPIARVSGLDIVGGSGISVSDNSGIYTIAVTGTFGLTGEEVDDRVGNLLTAGNYVNLNYNDSLNSLSINVTGVQPSGNYSVVGHSHAISDVSGLQNVLDSKQPSGVYASGIHNHTSSDIINFSSSVSGLLPVKNITSGSGISVSNNNGVFSVAVTGTFGLTSEQVDDRVNNLLSAGSYVALNYNDSLDSLTISVTGLQPSGNYSVNGHSHVIADVSGLENALDNKQPSGSYAQLIHNHLSSDITDFNSSVSGLLPNTYDAAVPWTPNHTLVDGTRYLAGDLVYESGRLYKANYDNESLPVSNTTYWADVGPGYRLNIDGRDIPNIQYPVTSVNGYSGIIELSTTDLNDFNSSVSGLLAPYALLDSPAFSGTPTVPTAPSGTNDNQIANTSFVRSEISNLVNSAPNTLDTLNELANALGNDPNFATTIASGLSQKSNIGHSHTANEITDFNSGVSGLLPSISGSGYVTSSFGNNIYTISVSGLQPSGNYANSVHTHSYADITDFSSGIDNEVSTLLVAGSYINLNYDNIGDTLTISVTGVQPSGSYANSVHSHGNISSSGTIGSTSGLLITTTTNGALTTSSGISSSYITNFNSSVSGLLPSVTGTGYVNSSFNNNNYTISVSGLQPSGNYSVIGHNHLTTDISNFNSGVSGLLPSVSGSGYITTSFNNNIYSISTSGLQPSGNYSLVGHTHTSSNITDFNNTVSGLLPSLSGSGYINTVFNNNIYTISVTGLQPSGNYSTIGHTHLSSNITDFNSSVSGLLPVTNILAGSNIGVSSSGSVFTVAVTGQLGLTTEEVDDRVASLLVAGTGIDLTYNDNLNALVITSVGSSPSGNYALVGHTHNSSSINDFNSSVSGLLPITNITGGSNISVSQSGTVYNISVTGSLGLTTEEVDDRVSNLLVAGTGISLDYNDGFNTLTINTSGLQPSGNYSVVGHIHTSADISDFNEAVDDRIGSGLFVAGTGVALSYNDVGNSFTVSVTGLINNPTNNRILTSRDSTTTGIDAESNLVFTGSNLGVNTSSPSGSIHVVGSGLIASVTGTVPNSLLHIYSATSGDNILNIEGTNGSLFSVTDNLSGTLMSVNNSAGLPVLEVFSDDRVIGGRYNQNDFVISSSGNVGIGASSPSSKFQVSGNAAISGVLTATSGNFTNTLTVNSVNVSTSGHTHTSSNITDFNSAVSGLLTKSIAYFTPSDNQPPASGFATLDTRNSVLVLEFDAASDESAIFVGYIPHSAILTNGLKTRISWMADTATSGNVRWGVQWEADGTDLDADSFDTASLVTSSANGTAGIETIAEIISTSIDSLVAGDRFRLKIYRDADDATNDTMSGDAQLVSVEVQVV